MSDVDLRQPPTFLLPLVLIFSMLASFANGTLGHGIFFVLKNEFEYPDLVQLAFGVALYLPYIPAAFLAGRISTRFGDRRTLLVVILGMAACTTTLFFVTRTNASEITFWIVAPIYNMFQGTQWPIVESYLTAGRHGKKMRRTIGIWNVTWATTIVFGLWITGGLLDDPRYIFGTLAVLHLVTLGLAFPWPRRAPHHDPQLGQAHRGPEYVHLLRSCKTLLFWGYVLAYALTPLLPGVWLRLEVPLNHGAYWSSTWLIARIIPFALLFILSEWHGRWGIPLAAGLLMTTGFLLVVTAFTFPMVLAGLCAFGLGHATAYSSALYYRMAVGNADVKSGGAHEGMIGMGYTIGPATALLGGLIYAPHQIGLLTGVGLISLIAMVITVRPYIDARATRAARNRKSE